MTIKEIIDGLKFTVEMFLFNPTTGETYKEPRNDMDKTTIDACNGAIELLEQTRWIPVSERLPKSGNDVLATDGVDMFVAYVIEKTKGKHEWHSFDENYHKNNPIVAWQPLPQPYRAEIEEV